MDHEYKTKGVCSRKINFSVEDGKVCKVKFDGGCNGNAIRRMEGIKCGMKNTSCPDQLAQALKQTQQ